MIAVWILAIATILTIVLIVHLAVTVRRHLRHADQMADRFVEAVGELSKDASFPKEVVMMLFELGKVVGSFRFAVRVGHHFATKHKRPRPWAQTKEAVALKRAMERMTPSQLKRYEHAMAMFLGSVSYRDPFFGSTLRAELMGQCREKAITKESAALANMFHDNHLAHA